MMILMIAVSAVLLLVALVHVLWAFGIWFPIREEETLARAVVGAKGVTRMPGPIPCALVAGGVALIVLMLWVPLGKVGAIYIWVAAVVLLLRGMTAYVPMWRRMTPEEPFATLDRTGYGPMCLALGLCLIIIQLRLV